MMKTSSKMLGLVALGAFSPALVMMACGSDETDNTTSTTTTTTNPTTSANGGSGGSTTSTGGAGGTGGNGTGGCGQGGAVMGFNCDAACGTPGTIELTPFITSGLQNPLQLTAPAGDPTRMFIIEKPGRIQMYKDDTLTEFLDITALVDTNANERGLLGLAFHPDYNTNGRFFVHYSGAGGDTVIAEYQRDANNPDVADPTPVNDQVLTVNQPFGNHNGGSIEFGFDGFLYIGLGDGGGNGGGNSQNTNTLLGALLRIDVSNPSQYAIPAGNIAAGSEIYDWGLRNPYRWTFDACTGDRYIGDVGQLQWEEIDVAANGDGNKNWGWDVMEGMHCYNAASCDMSGKELPAVEYPHSQGCSVTGGYVYRGSSIPWLRGTYLYGDYCSGNIWGLVWNNGAVNDLGIVMNAGFQISGFGQDDTGELYVMDYDGAVHMITAN